MSGQTREAAERELRALQALAGVRSALRDRGVETRAHRGVVRVRLVSAAVGQSTVDHEPMRLEVLGVGGGPVAVLSCGSTGFEASEIRGREGARRFGWAADEVVEELTVLATSPGSAMSPMSAGPGGLTYGR
ncbi:hypothetical protein [Acrocarpospora catenulata]|uniref:hypothetical protein n=1 Tax=Acrocarpospora catenulata TaxID=2836182 RepID=UPI001BDA62B2|nr:hypothetical protein [Acrocarpospora catenulata]